MKQSSAVFYEVSITVDEDIYTEYRSWLEKHVKQILALPGFVRADMTEKTIEEPDKHCIVIVYEIASLEYFHHYSQNHAPAFRQEGIDRFGDKIQITRRLFPDNG